MKNTHKIIRNSYNEIDVYENPKSINFRLEADDPDIDFERAILEIHGLINEYYSSVNELNEITRNKVFKKRLTKEQINFIYKLCLDKTEYNYYEIFLYLSYYFNNEKLITLLSNIYAKEILLYINNNIKKIYELH